MPRLLRIRTRTLLLIALAVIVAAQGLSLYLSLHRIDAETSNPDELDFLLEVFGEPGGVEYHKGVRPELPLFDRGIWTFDGQPLSEFVGHVEGLEVGPHGSSPYIIVDLPENASVGDYRRALASLSAHGICRVGVYSPSSNSEFVSLRSDEEPSAYVDVPVYRVLKVKFDTGASHDCIDRFPSWAPWAEYLD